jgi:hypothetical protein
MPQTHFPSMKATHNKIDITNGFGDSDFISCLKNGGIPFPVDGSIADQK